MDEAHSARLRRLHVRSRKLVEELFAGSYHSVFRGPGLEFNEVRDYQYGDDVRFIDWNVSSRMDSPYSKTFREEREMVLFMVVDISHSLFLGGPEMNKRELAGNLFALLSLAAAANSDKVGSLLFSDRIEHLTAPSKDRRNIIRQISEVLGRRASGGGSDLRLALQSVAQTLKRQSIVVLISDFRCDSYRMELTLLARKHDVIAVRLTHSLDRQFPPVGLVELNDPETGSGFAAWGRSRALRKGYAEFWEDHRRRWLDICRAAGVDTLEVDTGDDAAERLHAFFRRRKGA